MKVFNVSFLALLAVYLPAQAFAAGPVLPLPEPDTMWLVLIGVMGAGVPKFVRRKK